MIVSARTRVSASSSRSASPHAVNVGAIPLAGALSETWQYVVLAAAAIALLALRRSIVLTLLTAGTIGAVAALPTSRSCGLLHPSTPGHLLALVLAGAVGFVGNWLAALVRTSAGHRLESPALIADGAHARADAYLSLAVIASAIAIAAGAPILDPIIGLTMTAVILRITRASWLTVRGHQHP